MKYILLILLLSSCSGRFYMDAGMGYIHEVTVSQTSIISSPIGNTTIENEFSLPIESSFLLLRGGYKINNIHIEYEQIRDQDRHFQTARIYHRFEF